ncbi:MAG TPA: response regulator transcription factor [Noviherbaspirillum sp.]|nr:response regulator transcription factor [Noviherbaspirillum sp.]
MEIALLDQDKELAEAICATLRVAGHHCVHTSSISAVIDLLGQDGFDLLVLDAASAGGGAGLIRRVRAATPAIPVLLLSPRSAEDEITAALDAGANDYLIKPVRHGEIATRVQVLLKRTYPAQHVGDLLRFGSYAFDTAASRLTRDEKTIGVTQKEFELALLFFRHLGRPLSRAYIRETLWPEESELPSRTLDTHVSRVRTKLGLRPENGYRLAPVYSFGYQLEQLSQ